DIQLMSKHRVLSLKPQLRLESRDQDGHNEKEQPYHSASLGDSIAASKRIGFSVHTVVKDASRAADVISRIHDLVRKGSPSKEALDINEAILEVVALTRAEARKHGIKPEMQLADDLPPINGDRVQLQQVMINLIMNAIQAMSTVDEGTRDLHISSGYNRSEGVHVVVRDSGPGIDVEKLAHLFEPFYTTKPGGMGMGLSISRTIIEEHGGRLWVSEDQSAGALFQLTIPIN
ncbi:MAG TPA: ATP-binding protein, partial [Methylococcaceae bacterium]|nr:ATP-binding protein [Methylococcaceae bacterium]